MTENDLDALVTVLRTADAFTAELMKNALCGEGIECRLGGAMQAALPGVCAIELLVRRRDVDRATLILREFQENPKPDEVGWDDEDALGEPEEPDDARGQDEAR